MQIRKFFVLLPIFFVLACATTSQLSPQQRRAIQTRTFDNTSYENVFRAFKTILQDEGYLVKNQDLAGGLIVATIQKTDSSSGFWSMMAGNSNYRTGEGFEVSVNLEKISDSISESRMTVQKMEHYSQGGQQGHEILDPEIYQSLYKKVIIEVERRKATGKI